MNEKKSKCERKVINKENEWEEKQVKKIHGKGMWCNEGKVKFRIVFLSFMYSFQQWEKDT